MHLVYIAKVYYIQNIRIEQKMYKPWDSTTIHIEYCQDCDTHRWCTHHDQSKYLSYFNKLAKFIGKHFEGIEVIGNQVPSHLVPVQGHSSKYYDSKTKKYINYPTVGAFEVVYGDKVLFSKKKTNNWPDFADIRHKIAQVRGEPLPEAENNLDHDIRNSSDLDDSHSEEQINAQEDSMTDKDTVTFTTNGLIDNEEKLTTFYGKQKQMKNFTLTDHFKIYKMRKHEQEIQAACQKRLEKSQPSIKMKIMQKPKQKNSQTERKTNDKFYFRGQVPSFLKERAYIKQEKGKKQMIINLDSIEEQTFIQEQPPRRESERAKSKQVMKKWDEQLNFLQHKFKKVESSLSKIKQKNKQFDTVLQMQAEWNNRMNNKFNNKDANDNHEYNQILSKTWRDDSHHSPEASRAVRHPQLPAKLTKIDKYIYSTPAEKNKKLHQIYGEWKIIRKQNMAEPKYFFVKPAQHQRGELENRREKKKTFKRQQGNFFERHSKHSSADELESCELPFILKNKNSVQTMREVENRLKDNINLLKIDKGENFNSRMQTAEKKRNPIEIKRPKLIRYGSSSDEQIGAQNIKFKGFQSTPRDEDSHSMRASTKKQFYSNPRLKQQKMQSYAKENENSKQTQNKKQKSPKGKNLAVNLQSPQKGRQSEVTSTRTEKKSNFVTKVQNLKLKQNNVNKKDTEKDKQTSLRQKNNIERFKIEKFRISQQLKQKAQQQDSKLDQLKQKQNQQTNKMDYLKENHNFSEEQQKQRLQSQQMKYWESSNNEKEKQESQEESVLSDSALDNLQKTQDNQQHNLNSIEENQDNLKQATQDQETSSNKQVFLNQYNQQSNKEVDNRPAIEAKYDQISQDKQKAYKKQEIGQQKLTQHESKIMQKQQINNLQSKEKQSIKSNKFNESEKEKLSEGNKDNLKLATKQKDLVKNKKKQVVAINQSITAQQKDIQKIKKVDKIEPQKFVSQKKQTINVQQSQINQARPSIQKLIEEKQKKNNFDEAVNVVQEHEQISNGQSSQMKINSQAEEENQNLLEPNHTGSQKRQVNQNKQQYSINSSNNQNIETQSKKQIQKQDPIYQQPSADQNKQDSKVNDHCRDSKQNQQVQVNNQNQKQQKYQKIKGGDTHLNTNKSNSQTILSQNKDQDNKQDKQTINSNKLTNLPYQINKPSQQSQKSQKLNIKEKDSQQRHCKSKQQENQQIINQNTSLKNKQSSDKQVSKKSLKRKQNEEGNLDKILGKSSFRDSLKKQNNGQNTKELSQIKDNELKTEKTKTKQEQKYTKQSNLLKNQENKSKQNNLVNNGQQNKVNTKVKLAQNNDQNKINNQKQEIPEQKYKQKVEEQTNKISETMIVSNQKFSQDTEKENKKETKNVIQKVIQQKGQHHSANNQLHQKPECVKSKSKLQLSSGRSINSNNVSKVDQAVNKEDTCGVNLNQNKNKADGQLSGPESLKITNSVLVYQLKLQKQPLEKSNTKNSMAGDKQQQSNSESMSQQKLKNNVQNQSSNLKSSNTLMLPMQQNNDMRLLKQQQLQNNNLKNRNVEPLWQQTRQQNTKIDHNQQEEQEYDGQDHNKITESFQQIKKNQQKSLKFDKTEQQHSSSDNKQHQLSDHNIQNTQQNKKLSKRDVIKSQQVVKKDEQTFKQSDNKNQIQFKPVIWSAKYINYEYVINEREQSNTTKPKKQPKQTNQTSHLRQQHEQTNQYNDTTHEQIGGQHRKQSSSQQQQQGILQQSSNTVGHEIVKQNNNYSQQIVNTNNLQNQCEYKISNSINNSTKQLQQHQQQIDRAEFQLQSQNKQQSQSYQNKNDQISQSEVEFDGKIRQDHWQQQQYEQQQQRQLQQKQKKKQNQKQQSQYHQQAIKQVEDTATVEMIGNNNKNNNNNQGKQQQQNDFNQLDPKHNNAYHNSRNKDVQQQSNKLNLTAVNDTKVREEATPQIQQSKREDKDENEDEQKQPQKLQQSTPQDNEIELPSKHEEYSDRNNKYVNLQDQARINKLVEVNQSRPEIGQKQQQQQSPNIIKHAQRTQQNINKNENKQERTLELSCQYQQTSRKKTQIVDEKDNNKNVDEQHSNVMVDREDNNKQHSLKHVKPRQQQHILKDQTTMQNGHSKKQAQNQTTQQNKLEKLQQTAENIKKQGKVVNKIYDYDGCSDEGSEDAPLAQKKTNSPRIDCSKFKDNNKSQFSLQKLKNSNISKQCTQQSKKTPNKIKGQKINNNKNQMKDVINNVIQQKQNESVMNQGTESKQRRQTIELQFAKVEMVSIGIQKYDTSEIGFQISPDNNLSNQYNYNADIETSPYFRANKQSKYSSSCQKCEKCERCEQYQNQQRSDSEFGIQTPVRSSQNHQQQKQMNISARNTNLKPAANQTNGLQDKNDQTTSLQNTQLMKEQEKKNVGQSQLTKRQQIKNSIERKPKEVQQTHNKQQNKQVYRKKNDLQSKHPIQNPVASKENESINEKQDKSSDLQQKIDSKVQQRIQIQNKENRRAQIVNYLYGFENEKQITKFLPNNRQVYLQKFPQNFNKQMKAKWKLYFSDSQQKQMFFVNTPLLENIQYQNKNYESLRKALQILDSIDPKLIIRIFQQCLINDKIFGVWLCDHFVWKCLIIDAEIPFDSKNRPLGLTVSSNPLWLYLLQKALALCLGGYENLQNAQANTIIHLLTGANILSYKVREDPERNKKVLSSVRGCLEKKFNVICQRFEFSNQTQSSTIYKLQNIKKANNGEVVLQVNEIGPKQTSKYWLKLDKFVQEFKMLHVLQIRSNNYMTRVQLNTDPGLFSIVSLAFEKDGLGSITVASQQKQEFMKIYLYREQKQSTLKLIGEASQKQKNQMFFDCYFSVGKYYLFVQTSQKQSNLCFTGEIRPLMQFQQTIRSDGYKNDCTEYLQLSKKSNKQNVNSHINKESSSKKSKTTQSFQSKRQRDVSMQTLRQNFIAYLTKQVANGQ